MVLFPLAQPGETPYNESEIQMPFGPWSRDPKPCRFCKEIYDDERGRLRDQMIPCLQAHRRSATGQIGLMAIPKRDIGWPCPFACTLTDLMQLLGVGSLNTNPRAREILNKIREAIAKGRGPGGVTQTEGYFDIYDPRLYMSAKGSAPLPEGHYVVIKAVNHEPLWMEFKPWYLANVSASLSGWNYVGMMQRVIDTACAHTNQEIAASVRELKKPGNAAKFAVFVLVMAGMQLHPISRVLAFLIGVGLTAEQLAVMASLLLEVGKRFAAADTEAALDEAGMVLAKFFAQVVILGVAIGVGTVLGRLLRGVLGKSPKELENASRMAPAAAPKAAAPSKPPARLWKDSMDANALRIAAAKKGAPFFDVPNLRQMSLSQVRKWLKENGFAKVKEAENVVSDGQLRTKTSEIWYRSRPDLNGKVEAVRVDALGNPGNPQFASSKPHVHTDLVPFEETQAYLNMYVPELPVQYGAGNRPVPKYSETQPFKATARVKDEVKPTTENFYPSTHRQIRGNPQPPKTPKTPAAAGR
jgi:hypothetical protein